MLKKIVLLFWLCVCTHKTFAHAWEYMLNANQVMTLLIGSKESSDNILLPYFRVDNEWIDSAAWGGVIRFTNYKREYYQRDEVYDYDVFNIQSTGVVEFYTTNKYVYDLYKRRLLNFGFKYIGKGTGENRYLYQNHLMKTYKNTSPTGDIVYCFQIYKDLD